MPNEQLNPATGKWEPAVPLPEPRIWKLWRFLRLMPAAGPKEGDNG